MLNIEFVKDDPKTIILTWGDRFSRKLGKSLFISELRRFPRGLDWEGFLTQFSALEEKIGRRYAIYLLSQRSLLGCVLEEKLTAKGISLKAAKASVDYCREKGFLDDSKEIQRLVAKELRKGQSQTAIYYKLKAKKGIDLEVLRAHLKEAAPPEEEVVQQWLTKHSRKIDWNDALEVRKWKAKLCRKGFSPEAVFKAFANFL